MAVILVTGATGRHGGTGAYVARRLKQEGHHVRVLVRSQDERSAALAGAQFDVRVGDLHDRKSLLPALEGVSQATFCFPVDAGIVEAAANFSAAVRATNKSARVAVLSMIPAHPESPSHLGRAQWLAEEVMAWAGLDLCVLRVAALFYENLALLHGASVREHGVIRNCFGDARAPWITGEDAAELVVAALLHPERFAGGTIHYPSGSASHTHSELAEILTNELSARVRYEAISLAEWRKDLDDLARRPGTAINTDMAKHISTMGHALSQRGALKVPDAPALEHLLGRPPISFRQFIRAHASQFRNERGTTEDCS
jgi:uncharacterized protein YbjT (DUF2867 family)